MLSLLLCKIFCCGDGEAIYPLLFEHRNIVVIADEAHRSQYGFKAKVVDIKVAGGNIFVKNLLTVLLNYQVSA